MTDLYDKDGNIIEGAVTKEEADKATEEATKKALEEVATGTDEKIEEMKKANEAKIADLDVKITEQEELLTKAGEKDANFKKVREQIDALKKEKAEWEKGKGDLKSEILGELSAEKISEEINKRTRSNDEKSALVQFHYDSFAGVPKDVKERKERLDKACKLAGVPIPGEKVPLTPGAANFGGGQLGELPPPTGETGDPMSSEAEQVGKDKLGLSQEDFDRVKKLNK